MYIDIEALAAKRKACMERELTEMLADEAKRDAMLAELDRAMGEEDVT